MTTHAFINTEQWVESALCGGNVSPDTDPEMFFPLVDDYGASHRHAEKVAAAQTICGGCSVAAECLEYAVANRIEHGIWGGVSPNARRKLKTRDNLRRKGTR